MSQGAIIPAPADRWERVLWRLRGKRAAPPQRMSATYLLNLASGTFLVGLLIFHLVAARFGIGIVPTDKICIPGDLFLLHYTSPEDSLVRGGTALFVARDLGFKVKNGTTLVKLVAGLPGDRVDVTEDGISINGTFWGPLVTDVMAKANLTLKDVVTSYTIPEGQVLMLGTLPPSYDGRYFGPVSQDLILGKAWRLW
jgi:conjugal transfer pilin signal peptidase TrbI